jgi:Leucine-rich repeat (LRR) protein
MLQRYSFHLLVLSLLILSSCQGYDVTLNDRVVYTPAPLFNDFAVVDKALHTCLAETINAESITSVGQLTELNCSHAGIASLDGIATFTALVSLRLSSNDIRNLVEVAKLADLRELYLDDNRIVDPVPLYQLTQLRDLDISKNPSLQCPQLSFAQSSSVALPDHCQPTN